MNRYRALIFDIDDTLFDRNRAQVEIIKLIRDEREELFEDIDEDEIIKVFLKSDELTLEEFGDDTPAHIFRMGRNRFFLNLLGLDESHSKVITELYVRFYSRINTPSDGAVSVVEKLAESFSLGVLSNGHSDVQYGKLETIGLRHLFKMIIISSEVQLWKPDPAIFTLACMASE